MEGWKEEGGGRRREAGGRRRGGSSQGQPRPRKLFFRMLYILYYTSVMVLYHTRSQLLYISYGVQLPSELLIVHSFQTTGQVYFESHVFGYLRYLYVTELLTCNGSQLVMSTVRGTSAPASCRRSMTLPRLPKVRSNPTTPGPQRSCGFLRH